VTEADRAELEKIRAMVRDHPPVGPTVGVRPANPAGLHQGAQDR
jgi:hypothetical protein